MPRRLPDRKPRHRSPLIRGSANADVLSPFPPPETRTSFWLSNACASRGVSATGRRCAGGDLAHLGGAEVEPKGSHADELERR
jgi:hypothetical protein